MRHREDGAVVGQRAAGGYAAVGVGGSAQSLKPSLGHDTVAVEDHDIGSITGGEGAVDVDDKADVLALPGEVDGAIQSSSALEISPEWKDQVLRAAVVGNEHVHSGRGVPEHALQALGEELITAVYGDAHHAVAAGKPQRITGGDLAHCAPRSDPGVRRAAAGRRVRPCRAIPELIRAQRLHGWGGHRMRRGCWVTGSL